MPSNIRTALLCAALTLLAPMTVAPTMRQIKIAVTGTAVPLLA